MPCSITRQTCLERPLPKKLVYAAKLSSRCTTLLTDLTISMNWSLLQL